jgi:superfamily II DNA or RNA helicase
VRVPLIETSPLEVGAMAKYPYSPELEGAMRVETRLGDILQLSQRVGDFLFVPRECAGDWFEADKAFTTGAKIKIAINGNFPPRNEDQVRVIEESTDLLLSEQSHIIEASTGFGKTFVAVHVTVAIGRKTLIVVTKEDGMESWRKAFLKFSDVTEDDIGIIQQKKCETKGKKICIAMMHSLAKDHYPEWIKHEFGLVIWDEVHHLSADTFQTTAGMFSARWRLGLSATPKRVDAKEVLFHAHIGPVLVLAKLIKVPPKILVVNSGFKLPWVRWRINDEWKVVPLPHEAGKVMHIHKLLVKDKGRNKLIVDFVKEAYDKGRYTVVLSDLSVDLYLGELRRLLVASGVPDKEIAYYIGGMTEKQRDEAVTKKVVLATYSMAAENTDVPWWSALVLATPRANVKQAIGRVLREYPDKPQPVILDIVDSDSPVFTQYYAARKRLYLSQEIGGTVEPVAVG